MELGDYKFEIALFASAIAALALATLYMTNKRAQEVPMAIECDKAGGVLVIVRHKSGQRQPICFDKSAILYMED
jgi:hypothetical protein